MSFKATAIDMISAPNFYAPAANGWSLVGNNAQTLWLRLDIEDSLGSRPYVAANGATLQVIFQRADMISMGTVGNLVNTVQNVSKNAVANAGNRALWSFSMTGQDVATAMSGTVKFTLTENTGAGATTTTWVQNWMVKKAQTSPGF